MKDAGPSDFIPLYAAVLAVLVSVAPVRAASSDDAQSIAERFAKDGAEAEARAKREESDRIEAARKAFEVKRAEAQKRFEQQKRKEAEKQQADSERKAREAREIQLIEDMLKQEDERRLAEESARKQELERKAAEVAEENARKADDAARKAAELKQAEERARLAAEAQARRVAEEAAHKTAELQQARERQRLAAEAEAKRAAEENARKAADLRQAEERARLAAEADARRIAEDTARQAAELKQAEERTRHAAEVEAKRIAEEAGKAAAVAEAKKAADEIRRANESQSIEDARRQAEDMRLAAEEAKFKAARLAAEQRERQPAEQRERQPAEQRERQPAEQRESPGDIASGRAKSDEPAAQPTPILPASATPPASTVPAAGAANRAPRVTLILRLEHPSASDGPRRFRNEYTVDPIACFGDTCYVSHGSGERAGQTTVERALSLGNVIGARAGACNKTLSCIYRDIELPAGALALQTIDINVVNHDYLVPRQIAADPSCRLQGKSLACDGGTFTHEYSAWVVPEAVAEQAGVDVLEAALADGLPKARRAYTLRSLAAVQPRLAELARGFLNRVLDDHFATTCLTTAGPLAAAFDLAWSSLGIPSQSHPFGGIRAGHAPAAVLGNLMAASSPAQLQAVVDDEPVEAWRIIRGVGQLMAVAAAEKVEAVSPPDTLRIATVSGKSVLQVGSAIRERAHVIVSSSCGGGQRAARYDDDDGREHHWWRRR